MESFYKDKLEASHYYNYIAKKMQWGEAAFKLRCVHPANVQSVKEYNVKSVDYDRFQSCSSH